MKCTAAMLLVLLASLAAREVVGKEPDSCHYSMLQVSQESNPIQSSKDELEVTGESERLGRVISAWLFANTPELTFYKMSRTGLFADEQCPWAMCFGKYLQSTKSPTLSKKIIPALNYWGGDFLTHVDHEIYWLHLLKAVVADAGPALASAVQSYGRFSETLNPQRSSRHCTVHFRVGDLMSFAEIKDYSWKSIISPTSVATAVASFSPQPTSIEILGGGIWHTGMNMTDEQHAADIEKSLAVLEKLEEEIKTKVPGAVVFQGLNGTADSDWYKMATSPMLVFAAGSFATSAAMAGQNNSVLSPATEYLLYLSEDTKSDVTTIRPGWNTFDFEMQEW